MNAFLSALRQQVTPRVAVGLSVLVAIGGLFFLQSVLDENATREARITMLARELSELNALTSADDVNRQKEEAETLLAAYRERLLGQSTDGLNSAEFQSSILGIYEACGLVNPVIRVQAERVDQSNLTRYLATTTASDVNANFPNCALLLSELPFSASIVYVRWINSGSLGLNIVAFGEVARDD